MKFHRDKRWWMLGMAIISGGMAAWGTYRYLNEKEAMLEAKHRVEQTQIIVAAMDLAIGTPLSAHNLALREMPSVWVSTGVLSPSDFPALEGQAVAYPLKRGEPLLRGHLQPELSMTPFSSLIDVGRRAITIAVDDISAMAGLLQPNDYIDIYVSFDYRRQKITAPLLQRVRVLATGQQTDVIAGPEQGLGRTYNTVTLDTSPSEAATLIVARQSASISAVLRSTIDTQHTPLIKTPSLASLYDLMPVFPKRSTKIPVIYGDKAISHIPSMTETTNLQDSLVLEHLEMGDVDETAP